MDNREKLVTQGTQEEETKDTRGRNQRHSTICVGHHYVQTNTNNVDTTWVLLAKTQNLNTHNRTTQKLQRWATCTTQKQLTTKMGNMHTTKTINYKDGQHVHHQNN